MRDKGCIDLTSRRGLFVGLVTLDLVYLVEAVPSENQKIVALDYAMSAGGPATNAAVVFGYLGSRPEIVGVLGSHPMARLIRADLESWGVAIADLLPDLTASPPASSILVTQKTGDRAIISLNAMKAQADASCVTAEIWQQLEQRAIDVVLIDGHQMAVGEAIARRAIAQSIPVVVDGGSWKPGFEAVLAHTDYAICSANFYPPGCQTSAEVFAYLQACGVPHIAITQGANPIQYLSHGVSGTVPVSPITAADTLGAGDIFHGAFCHFILQSSFAAAIAQASAVAARSCQSFGTRSWMGKSHGVHAENDPPEKMTLLT